MPGAASLNWSTTVAPHSSVLLPVTWQPSAAGALSKSLIFRLDGKHRLQVKLLGRAVVEIKQSRQLGDQHLRQTVRRTNSGIDAPLGPVSRSTAGIAATGTAIGHASQPQPAAAARKAPGGSSAAEAGVGSQKQADQGKFKVPPRPSAKSTAGLRLKSSTTHGMRAVAGPAALIPPAPAAKMGGTATRSASNGGAARPERQTSADCLQASRSEAVLSPASPSGSLAPGQLSTEFSSPALLGGSVKTYCPSGRPLSKGSVNRSGRPVSGSSAGGSARKVPSSARKTFKFFHTE